MTRKPEPIEPGMDVVLVAPHYVSGLPGDGKVDMGDGRRLYPCEARAEMLASDRPAKRDTALVYWPNEVRAHHHGEPSAWVPIRPLDTAWTPTPPCPSCGARMVWSEAYVKGVDPVTQRTFTTVREVDISRHGAGCPELLTAADERAAAIRAGSRR